MCVTMLCYIIVCYTYYVILYDSGTIPLWVFVIAVVYKLAALIQGDRGACGQSTYEEATGLGTKIKARLDFKGRQGLDFKGRSRQGLDAQDKARSRFQGSPILSGNVQPLYMRNTCVRQTLRSPDLRGGKGTVD